MNANGNEFPGKPDGANRSAAFTLFEVVIALTILSLLGGTVFAILWRAADAAAEIREFDRRDEQVSRFLAMMRQTIESLPQGGEISMAPPEETGSGFYEMTVSGAATAFHFGELPSPTGDTVIGLRPLPGDVERGELSDVETPLYQVAISREDFGLKDADGDGMVFRLGDDDAFLQMDEEGRYWMPLLDFVTELSWRFWDEQQRDWLDRWDDQTRMPKMLEMSLQDPYRPAPLRIVFDLPDHLTEAPGAASSSTADTGSAGSADSSSSRPQPGADAGPRPAGDAADRPGGQDGFRRGDGKGRGGPRGGPPSGGRPEGGRPGGSGAPKGDPRGGSGGGRPPGPPPGGGAPPSTSR